MSARDGSESTQTVLAVVPHQFHLVTPLLEVTHERQETTAPHWRHCSTSPSPTPAGSWARLPSDSSMAFVRHRGTCTVLVSSAGGGGGVVSGVGVVSGTEAAAAAEEAPDER